MPVRISKGAGVTLANPVTFKITPLTVSQALAMGIIESSDLPPISRVSPNRAGKIVFEIEVKNSAVGRGARRRR